MKWLGWGLLAVTLAVLTRVQVNTWASEEALWTNAHEIAPFAVRPLVNLAALQVQQRQYKRADALLDEAERWMPFENALDRPQSHDAIGAVRALSDIGQGRLTEAASLICGTMSGSRRHELARQFASLCAPSSP